MFMKYALAGWHYPYRTLTGNIRFFGAAGFDIFSALGNDFRAAIRDEKTAEDIALALSENSTGLSVHYGLPDPKKPEAVEDFRRSMDDIHAWQEKYGLLEILSFDVWFEGIFPELKRSVELFADTKVRLAFEDYALEGLSDEAAALYAEHPFYLLVDAGHMNIRLIKKGCGNSAGDFGAELSRVGLPIIESHIHNNNGLRDMHAPLLEPRLLAERVNTFDAKEYLTAIVNAGIEDIVITIETIPHLYGFKESDSDCSILTDLKYVKEIISILKKE